MGNSQHWQGSVYCAGLIMAYTDCASMDAPARWSYNKWKCKKRISKKADGVCMLICPKHLLTAAILLMRSNALAKHFNYSIIII